MTLPKELKKRITAHIEEVQRYIDGLPADEEREILQSVETHIHDALENRASGSPDLPLLEAILAEMDPPESYGTSTPLIAPQSSSSGRKVGFLVLVGALAFVFIFLWLNDPFSSHWKSGPAYAGITIQEGAGFGDFTLNMNSEAFTLELGTPQTNHPDWLMRWDALPNVDVIIHEDGRCREIRFNRGFQGRTRGGIQLGSPFEDLIATYGEAELIWTRNGCVIAEWPTKGIAFWTSGAEVTQIIVRNPKPIPTMPFKNDPAVLGHWTCIDFVPEVSAFDPAQRTWNGELFLKELNFLPNGATSSHWTWTKGRFLHSHTHSNYALKQIDGRSYLFLEWMSGDVTERGQKPKLYVFVKE